MPGGPVSAGAPRISGRGEITMAIMAGLDIGTGGVRGVALDEAGYIVGEASSMYPVSNPHPGWSEQEPEDWWRAAKEVLLSLSSGAGTEISSVGLAGQQHGSVFLDASQRVIRPAILWNDQRTKEQCEEITARIGRERLISISGNPAITGLQAPKILWLRDSEPENYERLAHVLLPKDYVRLRLTGEFATDLSDASGTMLLDCGGRSWSGEILDALEIPRRWLPNLFEGPEETGRVLPVVADELGLEAGTPVAAGGGDNAGAAVGVGVVREGIVSSSVGTSGVLFAHAEDFRPDPSGRLHAYCHSVPGAYHLMGVTLSAGGSLSWWRDTVEKDYGALVEEASGVSPGADGLLFLPYLSGERTPHLDPQARGAFVGLTDRHTRAHMTRAVMEGVVFSMRESLDIFRSLGVAVEQVRATGGGARSPLWRGLQADIYRTPIHRTTADEGPAYGAALLGGVSAGIYQDLAEASGVVALREEVTEPDEGRARLYEEQYEIYRSLYDSTSDAMHRLHGIHWSP